VARDVITADPSWRGGDYYGSGEGPVRGLSQARKIGHITYLSNVMMEEKFGRERRSPEKDAGEGSSQNPFQSNFQVEGYLEYQGEKFIRRFDANSYLYITQAMDDFDLAERYDSLKKAFAPVAGKILVVALSTDWLFPKEQSRALANALLLAGKRVTYCELFAPHGHDAFLVDIEHLSDLLRAFLKPGMQRGGARLPEEISADPFSALREEHVWIRDMVEPGSRILDLGCGNGELLSMLAATHNVSGIGVDIDLGKVIKVIERGHDIFQQDIDGGLAMIPDGVYDYAILSETLQVVRRPRELIHEMLRVAHKGIISFPNFGKISHRLRLWVHGRMPVGGSLPFNWYDTPNIHLLTLRDFMELCKKDGIVILDKQCVPVGALSRLLLRLGLENLGADRVLVKVAKA